MDKNEQESVETQEKFFNQKIELVQLTRKPLMKAETIDSFEKETKQFLHSDVDQLTGLPSSWPFEQKSEVSTKFNQV